jgi:hypothetical protein
LHLVKNISHLFQVGDVSAIWIEGTIPRCALREGINEKFLNATGMDLEVKFVCDGVQPTLKTENADQRFTSRRDDGVNGLSYRTYHRIRLDL